MRLWQDDKHHESRSFYHGQVGVRVLGPGSRKVNGGPSVVLRVEPRDGTRAFEALVHEGYAQLFATFA